MQDDSLLIRSIEAVALREPIEIPVRTSFGTMTDRPTVFVRVTDDAGRRGYGEIWCNFPTVGAEHRQRLAVEVIAPLIVGAAPAPPGWAYARLMERLHVLAIQSGEWGPLRQVAAGIDAALHDLAARRAGLPLFRFLEPSAHGTIRAYASGIGPESPATVAGRAMEAGHRTFKLKVGFDIATDLASLKAIRSAIGGSQLMADANQAWEFPAAASAIRAMQDFDLAWLEEPLRADETVDVWKELASGSGIPLAAGENCGDMATFEALLASGAVRFIQPDVAKWGGVSGCMAVARSAQDRNVVYCPHFLGGGIGLLASAHLLAAQGGDGMLEMDTNPNGLRDSLVADLLRIEDGMIRLSEEPGIGIEPDRLFET